VASQRWPGNEHVHGASVRHPGKDEPSWIDRSTPLASASALLGLAAVELALVVTEIRAPAGSRAPPCRGAGRGAAGAAAGQAAGVRPAGGVCRPSCSRPLEGAVPSPHATTRARALLVRPGSTPSVLSRATAWSQQARGFPHPYREDTSRRPSTTGSPGAARWGGADGRRRLQSDAPTGPLMADVRREAPVGAGVRAQSRGLRGEDEGEAPGAGAAVPALAATQVRTRAVA
jgi:hypothetical protein